MSSVEPVSRALCGFAVCVMLLPAGLARAHITMTSPAPRTAAQKDGPCGSGRSTRGETVAVFEPGETIVVSWTETVDHTSHYRIAFDDDGNDDFVPPADRDDLNNSPAVLLDGIDDGRGGVYEQEVTLPDIECERCTLQLVQMMYGAGNYFQCADIALRRGGAPPVPPSDDAGVPSDDAGVPSADAGVPSADAAVLGGDAGVRGGNGGTLRGTCAAAPGSRQGFSWAIALAASLIVIRRRERS